MALKKVLEENGDTYLSAYWKLNIKLNTEKELAEIQFEIYKDKESRDNGKKPIKYSPVYSINKTERFTSKYAGASPNLVRAQIEKKILDGELQETEKGTEILKLKKQLGVIEYPKFSDLFNNIELSKDGSNPIKIAYDFIKTLEDYKDAENI